MFSAFVFVVALVLVSHRGGLPDHRSLHQRGWCWSVSRWHALPRCPSTSPCSGRRWWCCGSAKFSRSKGPGLLLHHPFIEQTALKADQRIMVTGFGRRETLTSDLVPINWWTPCAVLDGVGRLKKACLEVENYYNSVSLVAADRALRRHRPRQRVGGMAIRRNQLDQELQEVIEERTRRYGASPCCRWRSATS